MFQKIFFIFILSLSSITLNANMWINLDGSLCSPLFAMVYRHQGYTSDYLNYIRNLVQKNYFGSSHKVGHSNGISTLAEEFGVNPKYLEVFDKSYFKKDQQSINVVWNLGEFRPSLKNIALHLIKDDSRGIYLKIFNGNPKNEKFIVILQRLVLPYQTSMDQNNEIIFNIPFELYQFLENMRKLTQSNQ